MTQNSDQKVTGPWDEDLTVPQDGIQFSTELGDYFQELSFRRRYGKQHLFRQALWLLRALAAASVEGSLQLIRGEEVLSLDHISLHIGPGPWDEMGGGPHIYYRIPSLLDTLLQVEEHLACRDRHQSLAQALWVFRELHRRRGEGWIPHIVSPTRSRSVDEWLAITPHDYRKFSTPLKLA